MGKVMKKLGVTVILIILLISGCVSNGETTTTTTSTTSSTSTTLICQDGETIEATCPDGVTTYLNESCVDGEWHQVMYIRNPCEPIPTTTSSTTTTSTTATTTSISLESIINETEELDVVTANNQFAIDLYSELKGEEGNIFFSPYSISTALAMLYEGTKGQTADEIQNVFYLPRDDSLRRTSFSEIINRLNKEDAPYKLSTANALWIQENYPILKEYIETVEKHYSGKVTNLDFVGATEESRQTINTWVEEQTNNKIKDLFPQGSITPLARFVLTNAIYFKGNWFKQFDKNLTKEEEFRTGTGKSIQVPLMRQKDKVTEFSYAETQELQILEMLYEGEDLSMLVLLPKTDDLTPLEESLQLGKLREWKNKLRKQKVEVYIPKFTFESKYELNGKLIDMGMPSAFTPGAADLSGIDGTKELFISLVIHQAFVDVNEEGTEAAAATGIVGGITSMPPPPPVFRADHPFIFIIQEKETGNILFMGRVSDPSR
jgi:serpin B